MNIVHITSRNNWRKVEKDHSCMHAILVCMQFLYACNSCMHAILVCMQFLYACNSCMHATHPGSLMSSFWMNCTAVLETLAKKEGGKSRLTWLMFK